MRSSQKQLFLIVLSAYALISCHTVPATPPSQQPLPLSTETEAMIKAAEAIGLAIYEQDDISAKATNAMFREHILPSESRIRGWLTLQEERGWLVRFTGKPLDQYIAYYDVKFPKGSSALSEVIRLDPPDPLPVDQLVMVRARESALKAMTMRCSERYNTVTLPGSLAHFQGWVVYLLSATTTQGEIVFGGHSRVELSSDGSEVRQVTPLSKSCLRIPPQNLPVGVTSVGPAVTELISNTPTEIHAYLSLLHKKPIFVSTRLGAWAVEEGKIKFIK